MTELHESIFTLLAELKCHYPHVLGRAYRQADPRHVIEAAHRAWLVLHVGKAHNRALPTWRIEPRPLPTLTDHRASRVPLACSAGW